MKYTNIFTRTILLVLGLFLFWTSVAQAATLFISSNTDVLRIGDTLETIIKVDTEGVGVNAVQGTLQYPQDILEATKIDKVDSIFNFWLQEPAFSNDSGKITFVGGSTVGSVGKSLQVLRVVFKVKGSGRAELTFGDAAVTASDGSGTNVLSTLHNLVVNSVPKTGSVSVAQIPTQIPSPVQITRPAVAASGLPEKPLVNIPLYPQTSGWFNRTDNFIAQWKLPPDVSAVSTALDQNINYSGTISEGLFESKVFPAIARDGVWYLHIRFKNNIGWGAVNNYRIAVDTHPPLAFDTSVVEGNATDNPTPTLKFIGRDSLSGLKEYQLAIDNGDTLHVATEKYNGLYKLPLLAPGKHRITVRAVDNADNSTENIVVLETMPIASPVVTFVTRELFSDKQTGVVIKGSALPNIGVLLNLHAGSSVVARGGAHSDTNGNWEFTFSDLLKNGTYTVGVQSEDARGALSLVVESPELTVRSEPIIKLGAFSLGTTGAIILLLFLLILGFSAGVWYWKRREGMLAMRVGFAASEITKIFKLIADDVSKMSEAIKTPTPADDEYALHRLEENVKKMESYLKKGIEKIKR